MGLDTLLHLVGPWLGCPAIDPLTDELPDNESGVMSGLRHSVKPVFEKTTGVQPLTQTTCFSVWTISTRSDCAAMTASISL